MNGNRKTAYGVNGKWSIAVAIFYSLLTPLAVHAATYYIATNGLDSNSCSQAQNTATPKRNFMGVNGAMACLRAGDKLYVRGGTYNENISNINTAQFLASGTSWTNAILVIPYPGETVPITQRETVTVTQPIGFGSCCQNPRFNFQMSYWIFDGFNLTTTDKSNNAMLYNGNNDDTDHIRYINMDITNNFATNANPIGDWSVLGGNATGNCLSGGGDHFEFVNIHIHECGAYGIYFWGHDTLFDHIKVHDTYQLGVHIYHSGYTNVSNNTFRNSEVYNVNWTYRNGGMAVAEGILEASGDGNQMYNNVVHDLKPTSDPYGGGQGYATGSTGVGYKIYNNTYYDTSGKGLGISVNNSNVDVRNNLIYAQYGVANWNNTTPTFSNNHCLNAGYGCTSVGNPQFVGPSVADFHLQSISPAINTGTNLSPTVTSDRDGVARPQGTAYDIGAYEFASGSTFSRCDINHDNATNALDIQLLSNAILSANTASTYDINRDTAVNALDLQVLGNVVLGIRSCP